MQNESRYSLENLKVFIIDDNRHMRRLLQSILNALGVTDIAESGNAVEAYEALRDFEADVVIVDWHMKPMNGIEFVRKVRNSDDSFNQYVPIIMLSGYADIDRITEARDTGVNEFMAKPISGAALYKRFLSIIEHPRPFVRTRSYFGPDRRRQKLGPPKGRPEGRKDERKENKSRAPLVTLPKATLSS